MWSTGLGWLLFPSAHICWPPLQQHLRSKTAIGVCSASRRLQSSCMRSHPGRPAPASPLPTIALHADDAGVTARLFKRLTQWTSPNAGKLEVRKLDAVFTSGQPTPTGSACNTAAGHAENYLSAAAALDIRAACLSWCRRHVPGSIVCVCNHCAALQVIRPGTFTAQFIRATGLKAPVLIKGDRFNENPQMGLMWPDVHGISVDILSDYIGGDRKVGPLKQAGPCSAVRRQFAVQQGACVLGGCLCMVLLLKSLAGGHWDIASALQGIECVCLQCRWRWVCTISGT